MPWKENGKKQEFNRKYTVAVKADILQVCISTKKYALFIDKVTHSGIYTL